MKEREIRTPNLNLLFCKAVLTDEGKLVLELKVGKRVERIPVEVLLNELNDFVQGSVPKLHIGIE